MQIPKPDQIDVIAPNLRHRLSGVTTTVLRLVPVQARDIGIVATGPGLPPEVPHIPLWRVPFLPRRLRVWHARRNTEMVLGLMLRAIGLRYKLLFTSAAQRDHSGFTKGLIRRMDRLVATSPQAASYLKREAEMIMHGIDTEVFRPASDRDALRTALGLPQGLVIGCFGRIRHQKGQDLLVEAALELLPSRPDAHIVFTGRATAEHEAYQRDLEERLAAAGLSDRVRFLGERPWEEVVQLYQAIDLFVAPARWEGFGLTPIEAMACGTPALACHGVGAFDAQILPGETGMLCAPDDAKALTEALRILIDDREALATMRETCRAHVLRDFSIAREAAALIAIYREMLA
ncbi:glycosyltransferase family 4 protein [Sedimentimonas flavescens]|uniref:glycosyltransferase family 4 protein n=1 Tax=Sedimentimonas flavescens TaxID=2851012 RepID=UPI0021A61712|nr:glycosyltransferase family 4 protein [Sedimentimonas flavescens]MCT2540479.1 glycosyltransferase family 4 protein [Sedimentimonas flavescens]